MNKSFVLISEVNYPPTPEAMGFTLRFIKFDECSKQGIKLITICEKDWKNNQDQIKNQIKSLLTEETEEKKRWHF